MRPIPRLRLGGKASLAAMVGSDPIGDLIISDLCSETVDCNLVRRVNGKRSSFSPVFIDGDEERQIVNFRDENFGSNANWLGQSILASFDAALADTRWLDGTATVLKAACAMSRPGVLDAEAPQEKAEESLRLASQIASSVQGLRDLCGLANIGAALVEANRELVFDPRF